MKSPHSHNHLTHHDRSYRRVCTQ